jgi:3(or 17)beta-hydroxysteroid dehydrogenase
MGRVQDRVAIVTGSAKGMGAAIMRILAREGAHVIGGDVDEKLGEEVAAGIRAKGGDALFLRHDVSDEASWQRIVQLAEDRFGGLHILVNNAGVLPQQSAIDEMPLTQWRHTLSVDLDGVFLGCKHGVRAMKKGTAKGGPDCAIVNISSALGLVGASHCADYVAAKGGVRLLTKAVALECAEGKHRIRVNSIHPGAIDTPMIRGHVADGHRLGTSNEMIDLMIKTHPIGRLGEPSDIGNAVLFLASDEAGFITGSELAVDGGLTAQ